MIDKPLTMKQLTERDGDYYTGSRSFLYGELSAGRLRAVKFGRAIRVMLSERERYLASRPAADIRLADGK